MQIRDDANPENSLYALSLRWARADTNNFTYEDFIQSLNMAINRITSVIHRHDESWPWHDRNASGDLTDTSLTLTANTSEYAVSNPWLKIGGVRILQSDGTTWKTLTFKDRVTVSDDDRLSSTIEHYYLYGGKLVLVGKPSYTKANGIEITYQDGPTHITTDAGDYTLEVGFNPVFEELAALMPALDHLEINGPDEQARKVEKRIGIAPRQGTEGSGLLNELALSYIERNDSPATITLKGSNRALGLTDAYSGNNPMY